MKKKKELRKNWLRFIFEVLCVLALMYYSITYLASKSHDQGKKLYRVAVVDSLTRENAALRQALAAKMESHCDTMTIEQKLAQLKLDEYQSKMYEVKETQKSKAYSQKEVARSKAYDAKENNNVFWDNYSKIRTRATLELEKADSKVFAAYAVILFKEEKCSSDSYEFNKVLYKNREKIEKTAIVTEYLRKVQTADSIRSRLDGELGKKYQSQITEIEKKYQAQLIVIETNYSKKIATKKVELGL